MATRALMGSHAPFMARRSMSMCADGARLICFGGVGAAGTESILDITDSCWVFDTASLQWHELPRASAWPEARRCPGFTATPDGLLLWGGSGVAASSSGLRYTFLNDAWLFDGATDSWRQLRQSDDHRDSPTTEHERDYPCPRYTPVLVQMNDALLLFSGYTEDRLGKRKLNDTWLARPEGWAPIDPIGLAGYDRQAATPGIRYGSGSAGDGTHAYVFGGFSDDGDHNDLWQFNDTSNEWRLLAPESGDAAVPLPRYCAAVTHHQGRVMVFGGRSRKNPRANYNDLWAFDVVSARWECLSPNREPHRYDATAEFPGYHAKAAHAVSQDHWYVWGGEGLHGHVSDFWRFSLSTEKWELLQAARSDDPRFW